MCHWLRAATEDDLLAVNINGNGLDGSSAIKSQSTYRTNSHNNANANGIINQPMTSCISTHSLCLTPTYAMHENVTRMILATIAIGTAAPTMRARSKSGAGRKIAIVAASATKVTSIPNPLHS